MHLRIATWLKRGAAIVAVTMVVALWVMARPVSAPNPAEPTASATPVPTLTATPTPTSTPSPIPTWTPTPSPSPTLTPSPMPTYTATPLPTDTPTVAPTDIPTETVALATEVYTPVVEPTIPVTPTATPHVLVGRLEEHSYPSQITGVEEAYRIYLPPNYDQASQRYPVLYLLHGWPIAPADWDTLGTEELADELIVNGMLPPFIIVMPRSTEGLYVRTCGGTYSFEAQLINDLMPHIDATYRSWPAREGRAIGGISRGGVWALEISFMHPDLFAIVGAHSPALSVNMAAPACDPFYLMTRPGVADLRIYLDAGDADWARGGTEQLHQKLGENGIVHAYTVHSGRHDGALWGSALGEYLLFYAGNWWAVPQQ